MTAGCEGGYFEDVGAHDLAVANLGGDGVLSDQPSLSRTRRGVWHKGPGRPKRLAHHLGTGLLVAHRRGRQSGSRRENNSRERQLLLSFRKTQYRQTDSTPFLDKVNIGYMTALDVRKNRVGILTDFEYVDLSSDEISTPFGVLFSSAHSDSQMYILDPEIYGRVVDSPKGFVDAFGGIRYWHLRSNLDLRPGLLPAFHAS